MLHLNNILFKGFVISGNYLINSEMKGTYNENEMREFQKCKVRGFRDSNRYK